MSRLDWSRVCLSAALLVAFVLADIALVSSACPSICTSGCTWDSGAKEEICHIACTSNTSCANITCPTDTANVTRCVLECQGPQACSNWAMNCSGNCTIECADNAGCQGAKFSCVNATGDDDRFTSCDIQCRASDTCIGSQVYCEADSCKLHCISASACTDSSFLCLSPNCSLSCLSDSACGSVNISCPDVDTCTCEGQECTGNVSYICGGVVQSTPCSDDTKDKNGATSANTWEPTSLLLVLGFALVVPILGDGISASWT